MVGADQAGPIGPARAMRSRSSWIVKLRFELWTLAAGQEVP